MSSKNKDPKKSGYELITLCAAALTLGCVIPLMDLTGSNRLSHGFLLVIESLGALALAYVFGLYLLKR